MKTVNVTQARKEIYQLIELIEKNHEPVQITGKKNDAILIAKTDWNAIQETLYLLAIPGMRESVKEGLNSSIEECDEDIDW